MAMGFNPPGIWAPPPSDRPGNRHAAPADPAAGDRLFLTLIRP